jgi:CRISPR/Cas system CSM-associated protein Csm5 (group 7 of RAMP superfamily)
MDTNKEIQRILDESEDPIADLTAMNRNILTSMRSGSYPPGSAWAWMNVIENHIEKLQRAKRGRRRKKTSQ